MLPGAYDWEGRTLLFPIENSVLSNERVGKSKCVTLDLTFGGTTSCCEKGALNRSILGERDNFVNFASKDDGNEGIFKLNTLESIKIWVLYLDVMHLPVSRSRVVMLEEALGSDSISDT